jgi:hypothetical protein
MGQAQAAACFCAALAPGRHCQTRTMCTQYRRASHGETRSLAKGDSREVKCLLQGTDSCIQHLDWLRPGLVSVESAARFRHSCRSGMGADGPAGWVRVGLWITSRNESGRLQVLAWAYSCCPISGLEALT